MEKVELLAPAGSIESLYAAVNSGADAVYLGGSKFSARAYASNFDEENMAKAVAYCHIYGVKVHVTINTLIKDFEMREALDYAGFLYNIGVDALIVQDMGFAQLLKNKFPDFELHGSTQITVHNLQGAIFLKKIGFNRVVLSRELSIEEIREISEKAGIETEIFIQGALCICYSGQCLMSSIIGGRSGNRGRCAQPCRLPYTLIENNLREEKAYILSPKDMCTLDSLKEIIASKVTSLKIEGRMKRPEYVAAVAESYRKAIDSVYEDKEIDIKNLEERVFQLFNREGASKAYLFGNWGKDMMAYSNPKNAGIKLGVSKDNQEVELFSNLSIKDGIRVGDSGFTVSKITKDGKEVENANKGDKVKLYPLRYKKGDLLYKTSDFNLLKNLEKSYNDPYLKKVMVDVKVSFMLNNKVEVKAFYKDKNFKVFGPIVEEAVNKPLSVDRFIENLSKTQNTPFVFNIKTTEFEDGFIPVSSINEIRRDIIKTIYNLENKISRKVIKPETILKKAEGTVPDTIVTVLKAEQLKGALELGFNNIALDIFEKNSNLNIEKGDYNLYLKIPNIIKDEFDEVCTIIDNNLEDLSGIITGNLGIISKYFSKIPVIGDYKLNIFNKDSLEFYNKYNSLNCLSIELNKGELKDILKNKCQVFIYGNIELMVSEYCMVGSIFGGKTKTKNCNSPCIGNNYILKDRMGIEFPIVLDKYCRSHILNNKAINLIPNIEELKAMGAEHFRLDFTKEDYHETIKVLESFKALKINYGFENYTRGHYKRGVE